MQQVSMLEQVNKQPTEFGGTNVYISPTGSPDALVILGDIVAAHSRIQVIRGPLIPTNLVSPSKPFKLSRTILQSLQDVAAFAGSLQAGTKTMNAVERANVVQVGPLTGNPPPRIPVYVTEGP